MQLTQACDDCLENTHSFEKLNELLFLYMRKN